MAKKAPAATGKALMIVESPAKARTISKFLGKRFVIEASIGHVRDLPEGKKQVPAKYKDETWSYLGVNVDEGFEPVYIVPPGKNEQVKKLKALVKDASELWLATDEDREGEAISWHLQELLQPKIPVRRLVFHEITQGAIEEAMQNPRQIDNALVQAQETRRIVDRLYGYDVSPLLWRKLGRRLSAGRVQSVAVRLIVDRERERMKFVSATYFDLLGRFAKRTDEQLEATLVSYQGQRIPAAKDFDSATGKLRDPKFLHLDGPDAEELAHKLKSAPFRVAKIEQTPYTQRPAPPFTTSTLQQEANRKLGFTARRTMQVAQSLYENGHITYMRTDSTNLASVAVQAARDLVNSQYGQQYLPAQPRVYSTKVKNAQEAHEAIRPAGHPFELPESLRGTLSHDEFRLFEMIWKRTIASQMADARGQRISITIEGGGSTFQVGGKTIDFPGFLRAYVEGADDPQAELADRETILPSVQEGEELRCQLLEPKSHTTQPPARYNEATLTRALEDLGIGRPSTYAAIIETIQARDYVFKKSNALVPTWVGFAVAQLLELHLPTLVDYQFTAQMEEDLDAISRGEAAHLDYLKQFYFGNGRPGLRPQVATKIEEIDPRAVSRISLGRPDRPGAEGEEIFVRIGRYGPFLEQGERRSPIPDGLPPDELTIASALEMLAQAGQAQEPLGHCPETGKPVYLKNGRFGPYIQRGNADDEEKPKNASLLKGMKPEDVDLATALKLLSLPRTLGVNPQNEEPIIAQNGRFGPYIKCGSDTRSLPSGVSPIEVTLSEALELLAQPKAARRGFGAPKEPLRTLEASPVTGQPIKLLEGRYGFYVTDGVTNASLPKEMKPDELTLPQALDLLAIRAAAGPPAKKKRGFKRAAPKSAAPKKAPKAKKATKKAPASRKTAATSP